MNPYQIMAVITVCALLFAGVVALLAMQGMHVLAAFVCVYVVAVGFMFSMQRRARQAAEGTLLSAQQAPEREHYTWQLSTPTNSVGMDEVDRRRGHKFGA